MYFCGYTPPVEEQFRVHRDFPMGGGLSAEVFSFAIRHFASPEDTNAAWGAVAGTLEARANEVFEGTAVTYSPLSAPKSGYASVGVRIPGPGAANPRTRGS